jgi:hypothetical protein
MKVKGILIEGTDGHEYLLGFGRRPIGQKTKGPTLSRRNPDGTFHALETTREASSVARERLGITGAPLVKPGWGKDAYLWLAFEDALNLLPKARRR